jgi:hypothetical protein
VRTGHEINRLEGRRFPYARYGTAGMAEVKLARNASKDRHEWTWIPITPPTRTESPRVADRQMKKGLSMNSLDWFPVRPDSQSSGRTE